MNRRHLLARVTAGAVVAAAGCLDHANPSGGTDEPTHSSTDEPTHSSIDSQPCPPYAIDRDRVICSWTVDPDETTVSLEPEPRTAPLDGTAPGAGVTLTLHNRSATEFQFNPYSWSIWHRGGDGWTELEQEIVGDGVVTVAANDTYTWSFLDAVESIRDDPTFEAGLYAAEMAVPDPEHDDEWVACIALVRFDQSM